MTESIAINRDVPFKARTSLRNPPNYIFPIFVLLLFLWPKYIAFKFGLNISPYNIAVLLSLPISFMVMIGVLHRNGGRIRSFSWILVGIFFIEWFLRVTSDLFSEDPSRSLYLTARDFAWISSPFIIGITLGGDVRNLKNISRLLVLSSIIIAGIIIFEYSTEQYFSSIMLSNLPLDVSPEYQQMLLSDKARNGAFRAQSIFSHPLIAGELLACFVPISVAGIIIARRSRKIAPFLALLLCLVAIPMTGTRSSYVAAAVALAVFIALMIMSTRDRWAKVIGLIVGIAVAVPVAYAALQVTNQLQAGRNVAEMKSSGARILMWQKGWPAIDQSPMIGHGDGSAINIAGIRVGSGFTVDDFYLTQIIDFGYIHLAVISILFGAVCFASLAVEMQRRDRLIAISLAAGIFAIAVGQKATSIPEGTSVAYLFAGILAGLSGAGTVRLNPPNRNVRSGPSQNRQLTS